MVAMEWILQTITNEMRINIADGPMCNMLRHTSPTRPRNWLPNWLVVEASAIPPPTKIYQRSSTAWCPLLHSTFHQMTSYKTWRRATHVSHPSGRGEASHSFRLGSMKNNQDKTLNIRNLITISDCTLRSWCTTQRWLQDLLFIRQPSHRFRNSVAVT